MQVEIQTVEEQLEELAHCSKEYTDYHFLIQHRNPPRSIIYVNKRRLGGSCTELNCQLQVDGIKDIQQIDLIKTNKEDFEHEVISEKTSQPSVITVKQPPTCKFVHTRIAICTYIFELHRFMVIST